MIGRGLSDPSYYQDRFVNATKEAGLDVPTMDQINQFLSGNAEIPQELIDKYYGAWAGVPLNPAGPGGSENSWTGNPYVPQGDSAQQIGEALQHVLGQNNQDRDLMTQFINRLGAIPGTEEMIKSPAFQSVYDKVYGLGKTAIDRAATDVMGYMPGISEGLADPNSTLVGSLGEGYQNRGGVRAMPEMYGSAMGSYLSQRERNLGDASQQAYLSALGSMQSGQAQQIQGLQSGMTGAGALPSNLQSLMQLYMNKQGQDFAASQAALGGGGGGGGGGGSASPPRNLQLPFPTGAGSSSNPWMNILGQLAGTAGTGLTGLGVNALHNWINSNPTPQNLNTGNEVYGPPAPNYQTPDYNYGNPYDPGFDQGNYPTDIPPYQDAFNIDFS
jgi:hypothetical protein